MRKEERINQSWLPGIAFIVLIVATFIGISNMYIEGVVEIYKTGIISEDFTDLLFATLAPWTLCMIAVFIKGRDEHRVVYRRRMICNSLICMGLVVLALLVGFICLGMYNTVSSIAFLVVLLAKIYGYIRAFFFWILY